MKNIIYWQNLLDKYVDYKVGDSIYDSSESIWFKKYKINYLKMLLRNKDQNVVFIDNKIEKTISNENLVLLILNTINFLKLNGIKEGDTVFINLNDKINAIALSFACMLKNINFCFLFEGYTIEYIKVIDDILKSKILITDNNKIDYHNKIELTILNKYLSLKDVNLDDYYIDSNQSNAILLTSGTTSYPKAPLTGSFGTIIANIANTEFLFGDQTLKKYTLYNNLNFAWGASLIIGVLAPLLAGNRIILDNNLAIYCDVPEFNDIIDRYKINTLLASPVLFLKKNNNDRVKNIKKLILIGEKINELSYEKITQSIENAIILNCYGQNEVSTIIGYTKDFVKNKNIMTFVPELKGINKDGFLILEDYPSFSKNINFSQEIYKTYFDNNLFNTKDLVSFSNNEFEIIGREDQVYKKNGRMLDLNYIEKIINEKHSIIVKTIYMNEYNNYVLFIESEIKKDIEDLIIQKVGKYAIPKEIKYINKMPRNFAGKIDQNKLKEIINE